MEEINHDTRRREKRIINKREMDSINCSCSSNRSSYNITYPFSKLSLNVMWFMLSFATNGFCAILYAIGFALMIVMDIVSRK